MTKNNFDIRASEPVSKLFVERGLFTFHDACVFIKNLPYGRNENKNDPTTVFAEKRSTCSTKHALLRQLAIENNATGIRLRLGIFKMTKENTPDAAGTLAEYQLEYIPEAHNYLVAGEEIIDCTRRNSSKEDLISDLLVEIEIEPDQITGYKVAFHQQFLKTWLLENPEIPYGLSELWAIREKCISDLSHHSNLNDGDSV